MTNEENLNKIKLIAEKNNGKLLSPIWLGRSNKHLFEFSNGSQFETTPLSLKLNGWPQDIEKIFSWKNSRNKTKIMFHLSEGNTTTLLKLLSECETTTWCSLTREQLNNMYITCLSRKLLLLINSSDHYYTDEELQPIKENIQILWNSYIIKEGLDKIILADYVNIADFLNVLNSPISAPAKKIAETFKKNEEIYKKYHC